MRKIMSADIKNSPQGPPQPYFVLFSLSGAIPDCLWSSSYLFGFFWHLRQLPEFMIAILLYGYKWLVFWLLGMNNSCSILYLVVYFWNAHLANDSHEICVEYKTKIWQKPCATCATH